MVNLSEQQSIALDSLSEVQLNQMLVEWGKNIVEYPRKRCIHELFEEQITKTPNKVAVVLPSLEQGKECKLTYQELDRRANHLAHNLQRHNVQPGTLVALMMVRSLELIVAILGILKAGAVYVPLDPSYPQERLEWMIEDSQCPIIITQSDLIPNLPPHQGQIICLDRDWGQDLKNKEKLKPVNIDSTSLAYINYTSGSTGKPKGVAIPHHGVVRLLFGTDYTPLDGNQTLLQLAPISFDAATFEIWGALLHGGCCVLYPGNGLPDPKTLRRVLADYGVTTLWLTAALFNTLITEAPESFQGVKEILTGGEALSVGHIKRAHKLLPNTQLINGYGPTESTTFTCCYRIPNSLDDNVTSIPIGRPIANTEVYILDSNLQPVPIGKAGELYIGGDGLAQGYLNRPELTAERFIPHPFSEDPTARLYKTGDRVRFLADGNIEFIGRLDNQVKLRGYRIELSEIEKVLTQNQLVREAVVICREDNPGNKYLAAYITSQENQTPIVNELKDSLRSRLPEYMVPTAIMVIDSIPLTANGKVDRNALPLPDKEISTHDLVAPKTKLEKEIAQIWCELLELEQVSIEENFFDLGGTSLLGLKLLTRIQKRFGFELRAVKLYQYPTIQKLAYYLTEETDKQQRSHQSKIQTLPRQIAEHPENLSKGIAIIGMVGRFPGAASIDKFWDNLCHGVESSTFFAEEQIDPSVDRELLADTSYVSARGIIEGAELFDANFFNISPREAEVMDPQSRVFLELAYEALENAGYTAESFPGKIGLYAGSGQNTYFENHICGRSEIIDRLGAFQTMLANEKDFVTTRISYKLNLTGPSISINTACSTSLVAIIQAFYGLKSRQCDMALAGGISISTPQNRGYLYQEGGMLSPDGRCRPFDANGNGTMFNNGAGIVILKRLEDAQADGDRIYAVIRGVGMNNDGSDKVSFTAPSVNGQMNAILEAQLSAGIEPETIDYIETHGTATHLGDPIELEALTQAFHTQTDATEFCAIGSVKSNVGHLVAAAGVTGVIKTALALYHQQIPPSLNFESPNPEIDFKNSPFYVNTKLIDWKKEKDTRRAGVSSFGVGGTNAHIILEEAPQSQLSNQSRPYQLLLLSAKTETALQQKTEKLENHLEQHLDLHLADVAYTLQQGRQRFNYRRFVVCKHRQEAITALESLPATHTATRYTEFRNPDIVFMFPGQGSQYVNMGENLYRDEPVFRKVVDRCFKILQPLLAQDLRGILYPSDQNKESAALLRQTVYTQPALFTIEYALAQLWLSWGIEPAAMIGHSIGEFVAACLAGVFSLEDALKIVVARGKMMWDLPPGSMLSVRKAASEVEPLLPPELTIAAINGPSLCVVSGPKEQITSLQSKLETKEVVCKFLHTSHAFHSPMMDEIVEPFAEVVRTVKLSPPQIPFISTVTADWITEAQATEPMYWANHLRATVRFAEGIQKLWQQPERVLLEVGPRTTTATLARQQAKDLQQQIAISSLGSRAEDNSEWLAILQAMGQLWLSGVQIDWQSFYLNEKRSRLPLPTYPFERQRYWIDPIPANANITSMNTVENTINRTLNNIKENSIPQQHKPTVPMPDSRKQRLIPSLKEVLETTSGLELANVSEDITFLEMGLDSLSLTQVAIALKKKFKVKIAFRNLLEDYPNLGTLAEFLDKTLPEEALPASAAVTPISAEPSVPLATLSNMNGATELNNGSNGNGKHGVKQELTVNPVAATGVEALVAQQLQIMTQQLELLRQGGATVTPAHTPQQLPTISANVPLTSTDSRSQKASEPAQPKKNHGPGAKIKKSKDNTLTDQQLKALDSIIARYTERTKESKRQAQEHRRYLADPRTVSGFSPLLKEMIYPIVTERSAGSRLWDVDDNEYIDITNGFGLNFFGWSPEFVKEAVIAQLNKGIEIGPQTPLAGRVAKMITELTGMERVAFCNTGSEAVMATFRLARTITGNNLIATFAGDYHGTFDEVLYRPGANLKTLPAAPGLMPSMFENLLVLDYGSPESLEILRTRADELAGVLVEPVRSRDPGLQPKEFLQEVRRITEQSETAFIFDEVVTGFRVHPGGAQAYFNIKADLATYGKVVGGGLPIGIVAGKAEYMDALDGGFWQFGDNSIPEVGVTFFAGTFVRHPMALAAAEAVLLKLKEGGLELQQSLSVKVEKFVKHLRQYFERVGAPINIDYFSSFFYVTYPAEVAYGSLLFYLLREKGVHIWEYRPCFFTLAHTDKDIEQIIWAFKASVSEMQSVGLLASSSNAVAINRNLPPQPEARLGKDPAGNPAWFIPDSERPGKFLQLGKQF
ncbi:MAG: amino acid adenylation domain-containing protein [Xenococcus sp. MO_188.B8]|nr:amino acid adenylation domain-containing protein [Xenococcus sp. MO_188.B8]